MSDAAIFSGSSSNRCVVCKGAKMMCGKDRCPILIKHFAQLKARPYLNSLELEGSSPPGVFIGSYGYPKVSVGPLIPPVSGDTTVMDTPEMWLGKSIDEIVDFRSQLVRGMQCCDVHNIDNSGRTIDLVREMALSSAPTEAEALFERRPAGRLVLDDEVQPFGPSAPLKKLDVGNLKIDHRIEKPFYDRDLPAREAVLSLYKEDIFLSRIQKAFSVGAFGLGKKRKFVPTRWSITAVDDTIGKELRASVKTFPLLNEYRLYESWTLDNRFLVLLMPTSWRYELVEAWYPNTIWNPSSTADIMIISSHEGYEGRKTYAEIGGCYYAARLATCEHLTKLKRQAGCVILREAHSGYVMPVGVWNVRENVRNAYKGPHRSFATLQPALEFISTRLDIRMKKWMTTSHVLHDLKYQRRIEDFLPVDAAARATEGIG